MLQLVIWTLFSLLVGVEEGGLFSHGNSNWPFNIHYFLVPVRILIALALVIWSEQWICALVYALIFTFFHDGAYYQTRHYIDVPAYNFFSESTTSTAKMNFGFVARTAMMIGGYVLYFIWPYIKLLF